MLRLSLRKKLQVSKLYIIFGATLQLSKDLIVSQYWAKLAGISYEERRFVAALTTGMYTISDKK